MVKTTLIEKVAEKTTLTKAEVKRIIDATEEVISDAMAEEGKVTFGNLGNFRATYRNARTGRNPQTGETIQISERVGVVFKASKALNEKVNNAALLNKLK